MCTDYQALNRITVKDRYPLSYPGELLDCVQGKTQISKVNFWSGCHQHLVVDEDVGKTAFIGPDGLWEWLVMPFRLANAPAEFIHLMSDLLKPHIDAGYCIVFLNDVTIMSKTGNEHQKHVRAVMDSIRSSGFELKPEKCSFNQASMAFLGFQISADGITLIEVKMRAMQEWPLPDSPKEMRK